MKNYVQHLKNLLLNSGLYIVTLFVIMYISMENIVEFLRGKKTYIVSLAIAVIAFSFSIGWIDSETAMTLYGLLGAGGFAALRDGVRTESN